MDDQKGYSVINEGAQEGAWTPNGSNARTVVLPAEKPFAYTKQELAAALLMYVAAYVYIDCIFFTEGFNGCGQIVFAALFAAVTEILCKGRPRSKESWFWLGGLIVSSFAASFSSEFRSFPFGHEVWDYSQNVLFMHLFGVWWVMSRSGVLLEGGTGHLLPFDAFNGFLLYPFSHFFLRLRVLGSGLRDVFAGRKKHNVKKTIWAVCAIAASVIILNSAVELLADADGGFARLMEKMRLSLDFFEFDGLGEYIFKFVLSLLVAAYLFGLQAGSLRREESFFEKYRGGIERFINALKRIPLKLWIAVICVFSAIYIVFFAVQGSYLFGAFAGRLPDGFIPATYARSGFFELCKVTALNFSLLWLVTRSSETDAGQSRALRAACTVFLAECMLFCAIAMSKLALYISIFGFTPLRLQSSWLVCVLFAACVCWTVSLYCKKKVFRQWTYFSAASLILLFLY